MKKTALKKNVSIAGTLSFLLITTVFFTACKDEKEQSEAKPPKINCVTITRSQLQAWVDSGWTKPGSQGQINEIVLQFLGTNGGSSLQLIGYPGSSPATVRNSGKITLAVDTTCTVRPFTGDVVFGNNILRLGKLGIFNKNGQLNKFDVIKLTPNQNYPPYISFKVEVVNREQGLGEDDETWPCPEYCPPPTEVN